MTFLEQDMWIILGFILTSLWLQNCFNAWQQKQLFFFYEKKSVVNRFAAQLEIAERRL